MKARERGGEERGKGMVSVIARVSYKLKTLNTARDKHVQQRKLKNHDVRDKHVETMIQCTYISAFISAILGLFPPTTLPSSFSSMGESRLFNSVSIDSFLSLRPGLNFSDRAWSISSTCLPANWGPPLSVRPCSSPNGLLLSSRGTDFSIHVVSMFGDSRHSTGKNKTRSGPALSIVVHRSGVQRDRNLWSCDDRKGYSPEDQHFLSIFPNETAAYFVITAPPI